MTTRTELPPQTNKNPSISNLERKIILEGENKELLQKLAEEYYRKEQFSRALNYYLKLLAYESKNARIWNKLAVIFLKMEMYEQAIEMSKIAYRIINIESHSG
ncbi:MAG: tetratricopeptide repeat protein [Asgard group archaeon]|nr:tetratricopeptide repeat protein [Asgard group archaeon]